MADAAPLCLGVLGAITAFIDEHKRCGDGTLITEIIEAAVKNKA